MSDKKELPLATREVRKGVHSSMQKADVWVGETYHREGRGRGLAGDNIHSWSPGGYSLMSCENNKHQPNKTEESIKMRAISSQMNINVKRLQPDLTFSC